MTGGEDNFNEDVERQQEAVRNALSELTEIKAYTLKPEELRDFKAAQYALRSISNEHADEDVARVYDE